MRIGMMADTYKPHVSGITHHIELSKRYLEKAGHRVYVFTFGETDREDDEPNIIRSPGFPLVDTGYYFSFRYSPQAKKLLQTMDVVHVHHPFLSGRLALRYCRPLRIPIVFTNHTRYDLYAQAYLPMVPEEVSKTLLQTYLPSFCAAVDLVISPSPSVAKVLRELGVEGHIEIVPNGVDLERFHRAEPLPRADFGFRAEDILIAYVGRLGPEKNLPLLLQAFFGAAEVLPEIHLLLLGDGPEKERLEGMAAGSHCAERVHFLGMISYEKLPSYLAMCDLFATASVTEVHPLSVIEAMGAGLPVVGVNAPGVGDTVEDGVTGLLTSEDTAALAAGITRLCLQGDVRRAMGEAARQASTQYSIERTTRIMLSHYERLVYTAAPHQQSLRVRLQGFLERFRR